MIRSPVPICRRTSDRVISAAESAVLCDSVIEMYENRGIESPANVSEFCVILWLQLHEKRGTEAFDFPYLCLCNFIHEITGQSLVWLCYWNYTRTEVRYGWFELLAT